MTQARFKRNFRAKEILIKMHTKAARMTSKRRRHLFTKSVGV
ncbi:hypothetical protein CAMRE0001_2287 [Campylobacter rectus RM3267]|uniref:Uncharacterized protein n=1 Tax=Campylobacter rectus RM3267 TaxID=553218 RepID=B9D5B3_CAMRE|nr:hypothetical protein CAMRE0001_2287 [Campylobacter rectus RM3267]